MFPGVALKLAEQDATPWPELTKARLLKSFPKICMPEPDPVPRAVRPEA